MTFAEAKALKNPGFYSLGDTLYLRVGYGEGKSWIQRLTINGKRHDIGLGSFKLVTLAEARDMAFENRKAARIQKRDPLAEKHRAKLPTFEQAARQTWEALKPRWKDGKHTQRWIRTLEKYAFDTIGSTPINKIGREDVLRILTPLWTKRPEIARRLRMKMKQTFTWAQAHGFIESNPAGEMIDGALPSMPAVKEHFRALNYQDVPSALDTIKQSRAGIAAKLAFRFLVLTATRSGETRGATWDEIDLKNKHWTINAGRMKGGKAHRIPLSNAALAVLKKARILDDGSGLVFPSVHRPGKELSDMTITKLLRDNRLADRATVHGFRSSFRDWCADTGKPRELAEAALSHVVGGVEGAYFRSDMIERRRLVMEQWGAYVTGASADVVQLRQTQDRME